MTTPATLFIPRIYFEVQAHVSLVQARTTLKAAPTSRTGIVSHRLLIRSFMRGRQLLTMLFFSKGITPSLTQKPHPPVILASIISVVSLSPTNATCAGSVTPVSGCFLKYSMISWPHPGFFTECDSTVMPVFSSTSAASFKFLSQDVAPAVFETTSNLRPGYASLSFSK